MNPTTHGFGALSSVSSSEIPSRERGSRKNVTKTILILLGLITLVYILEYIRPLSFNSSPGRTDPTALTRNCVNWHTRICKEKKDDEMGDTTICENIHGELCEILKQAVMNGMGRAVRRVVQTAVERAAENIGDHKGEHQAINLALKNLSVYIAEHMGNECHQAALRKGEREIKEKYMQMMGGGLGGAPSSAAEEALVGGFAEVRNGVSVEYVVLSVLAKFKKEIEAEAAKAVRRGAVEAATESKRSERFIMARKVLRV